MKRTKHLIKVAGCLMADPSGRHWGYELSGQAGIRSGVMYPLLRRMLDAGWLEDGWEDPATTDGRPPRRYYTLTTTGMRELGGIAAAAPGTRPALAPAPVLREEFAR